MSGTQDIGDLFEELLGRGRASEGAPQAPAGATPEPGCPGCRFVRGWGALYRAVWEAGDRHGDLYDLAEALSDEAVDRPQLAHGLLRASQCLDELEAALALVERSVACFGPPDDRPGGRARG